MTASKIGRNAGTGKFTTVQQARRAPATHVVETIKRQAPAPSTQKKK